MTITRRGVLTAAVSLPLAHAGRTFAGASRTPIAPALILPTFEGEQFDLAEQRGRVVLVSFWATWCAPCRIELPTLEAVYANLRSRSLRVIAASCDRPSDMKKVRRALEGTSFPAGFLAMAKVNGFGEPRVLPSTLLIDQTGSVRARFGAGGSPLSEESLKTAVRSVLA